MILVPKSFFISFSLDFRASHQRVYWRCHICHFKYKLRDLFARYVRPVCEETSKKSYNFNSHLLVANKKTVGMFMFTGDLIVR